MEDRANSSSNNNQINDNAVETTLRCNLSLLSMASRYISEKEEESETTMYIPARKRMKLWNPHPSVYPTAYKGNIKKRSKKIPKGSKLTFGTKVMVFEIPSRHEYSNLEKSRMWRGMKEIRMNARRNRAEFSSEGWDWRTVMEDEDMYEDLETGEMIHPCWVDDEDEDDEMAAC